METLLSTSELASRLGLNPETIRRLVRSDKIPHVKVGKSIRFRLSEVATPTTPVFDPRLYVENLIQSIKRGPLPNCADPARDIRFKEAHAEGATAVLRDMGIFSTTECEAWRSMIRSAAKAHLNDAQ